MMGNQDALASRVRTASDRLALPDQKAHRDRSEPRAETASAAVNRDVPARREDKVLGEPQASLVAPEPMASLAPPEARDCPAVMPPIVHARNEQSSSCRVSVVVEKDDLAWKIFIFEY
jgi:hypothetical protein